LIAEENQSFSLLLKERNLNIMGATLKKQSQSSPLCKLLGWRERGATYIYVQ